MSFCEEVRKETDVYWEGSFHHPFVKGIVNGTLPIEKFKYYMLQDAYYLKHYTKILAIAASKAETNEDITYFIQSAQFINESELELHRTVFKELNVTQQEIDSFEPAPAAYNYISHMYNAAHNGDVAEAFAAMFPCPWLYQEIGEKYKDAQPGVKLYEEWIEMYSHPDFKEKIEFQKSMMDRYAVENPKKIQLFKAHFHKSCYFEWKFWEMAWTLETFESEVTHYDYV
ncbi:thiaminase II [Lysinibacillus sp. BW-2-10]|uniref:thiaminase II n=1 Tax=Lysinibacillus sp. BW-2-10 TaxID=2590030 RepID=UPI00118091BB|nr:thiaminase II [Lysinibacillus sp. BW-2-10]TSI05203.1 thiaminase II [Lysinibacillus sp. BW-2-10]